MVIGYTTGVFDLIHVGHVRRIQRAKSHCEYLIVGVSTDACAATYKRQPIIPFDQRVEIVQSLKYVDRVVPQETLDKYAAWLVHQFNVLIVGDDAAQRQMAAPFSDKLQCAGVRVVFEPPSEGVSTSDIIARIIRLYRMVPQP